MNNKYNLPRKPQGNNKEYNKWYEDDYYRTVMQNINGYPEPDDDKRDIEEDGWRHNGVKHDVYHLPNEGEDYVEDDYTVGQKFEDRTQFPHR